MFSTCVYTSFLSHGYFLSICTDSLYTCSYSHLSLHIRHLFAEIAYQITQVPRESPPVQPRSSGAALMVAHVMLRHGYEPGRVLGRNNDGVASLVEFKENRGRFGLGYEPTRLDVRKSALERRGRSMGQLQGPQVKGIPLCHISESFISMGWMCEGQVAMIHDEVP